MRGVAMISVLHPVPMGAEGDCGGGGSDDPTPWSVEVTELLCSRDCSHAADLLWTAFGFGSWEESTESTDTP